MRKDTNRNGNGIVRWKVIGPLLILGVCSLVSWVGLTVWAEVQKNGERIRIQEMRGERLESDVRHIRHTVDRIEASVVRGNP